MDIGVVISAVLLGLVCLYQTGNGDASRVERQILYPPPIVFYNGGTYKLILGVAVPISIRGRLLSVGHNIQFQYPLPRNASYFTNYFDSVSTRRRRRSMKDERSMIYRYMENEIERWGANGKDCLMRSICEAAETPLRDEGLVGELLHVLLTPNYGGDSSAGDDYLVAHEAGLRGDDCRRIYPSCPDGYGVLDNISKVLGPG
ncbi:uncharacterized protein LOC107274873 [Cephus cinctus]|uniref:Uncharacterized protein LOC107274873 n=1 Tax=Cephus cinctus TaxID=211228 RepID=A0AAJ7CFY3_CEPCN|nr:uncharacterized protein LOC107274873 [Cephus cinctus]